MLDVPSKSIYELDEDASGFDRDINGMQKKRGQNRGADGKFESSLKDLDDDIEPGFGANTFGSQKQTSKQNKVTKFKENDPFEARPVKRRKGRGAVANVFYDSQLPDSQPQLANADSLQGSLDSRMDANSGLINDKNGKIFGGKGLPSMDVGDVSMLQS